MDFIIGTNECILFLAINVFNVTTIIKDAKFGQPPGFSGVSPRKRMREESLTTMLSDLVATLDNMCVAFFVILILLLYLLL